MSNPLSGSKGVLVWKLAALIFVVLTVGASSLAYYYNGQNQTQIQKDSNDNAKANDYYSKWQSDEAKISTLNLTISSDNKQITSDTQQISLNKQQISSDQSMIQSLNIQISQLQSGAYDPSCKPNCDAMISSLQSQITQLNVQINTDQTQIASLQGQIASLQSQVTSDNLQIASLQAQIATYQDIVGLKKSFAAVTSVTLNEPACGGTGNPVCLGSSACTNNAQCIPQSILPNDFITSFCSSSSPASCQGVSQGVLLVSWSSTVLMSVSFSSSFQGSTDVTTTSTSTGSGNFAFPIYGTFSSTGFHNDSCHSVGFGNYACDAVSLTYSETFYY